MQREYDGPYVFTFSPTGITFNPKFKYQDDLKEFFEAWRRCMQEFEINPEFNANGNLHYHGYFTVKDRKKWYEHILPRLKYKGMFRCQKVYHDFDKAIAYSRKERDLVASILKGLPVPYTFNKAFPSKGKLCAPSAKAGVTGEQGSPLDNGLDDLMVINKYLNIK